MQSPVPAPSRPTDFFDFLRSDELTIATEDEISVKKHPSAEVVEVTLNRPDGRSLSRTVPAQSWSDSDYRDGLIRSLSMLLA